MGEDSVDWGDEEDTRKSGTFVQHTGCPKCKSSDAFALYKHDDGTFSATCFSAGCGHFMSHVDPDTLESYDPKIKPKEYDPVEDARRMDYVTDDLICVNNPERRLPASIYEYYGCRMELAEDGEKIEKIYYPTYLENELGEINHVGYRVRGRFKPWHKKTKKHPELNGVLKNFYGGVGYRKQGISFFGQWLYPAGGERLILTCGEEDAMAVKFMLNMAIQEDRQKYYPVESFPSGEGIKHLRKSPIAIKYMDSFDKVYLVVDQDGPGEKFAQDFCDLLPVGKVHLVRCTYKGVKYKDPCDFWRKAPTGKCNAYGKSGTNSKETLSYGRAFAFRDLLFSATPYSPNGVVTMSSMFSSMIEDCSKARIPLPSFMGKCSEMTHLELGGLVNIVAGTSAGKSTLVRQLLTHLLKVTPYKIGLFNREGGDGNALLQILCMVQGELVDIQKIVKEYPEKINEYRRTFNQFCRMKPDVIPDDYDLEDDEDRVLWSVASGASTPESIIKNFNHMIMSGAKIIIFDPYTLMTSGIDINEVESLNAKILAIVESKNILLIQTHQVNNDVAGKLKVSRGAELDEENVRGAKSPLFNATTNIVFFRDKLGEEGGSNLSFLKITKSRPLGTETGYAGSMMYNPKTCLLEKGPLDRPPKEDDEGKPYSRPPEDREPEPDGFEELADYGE